MDDLDGKVCVVTGGASGIGLAMARRFQQAGMSVAIGDIEAPALDQAVAALGGADAGVVGVRCDVGSVESVQALRDATLDRFGGAHVVCLNAGVAPVGPLIGMPMEAWRWTLDVNVYGVAHGIAAFGEDLLGQGDGHFVLTASAAGLMAAPSLGAYTASKHAVVGIAGTLREELSGSGVGVSVLCPGLVRTRIFESERNRPDDVAEEPSAPDTAEMYRGVIEGGVDPAVVAGAVHDAVLEDRHFIIPTADVVGSIEARLDEIRAALPPG